MEMVIPGIVFKADCHYETEEVLDQKTNRLKKQEIYKGFSSEGVVFFSNVDKLKKGDKVLVTPWGGSEISSMATKKNKFLVIEQRDILLKL